MSVDLSGGAGKNINLGGPQPGGRVPTSEGGGGGVGPDGSVVNQVMGTAKTVATRGVGRRI